MVVFLWQRQAKYIIAFASCTAYSHHFGAPQTTPYLTPAHDAPQLLRRCPLEELSSPGRDTHTRCCACRFRAFGEPEVPAPPACWYCAPMDSGALPQTQFLSRYLLCSSLGHFLNAF